MIDFINKKIRIIPLILNILMIVFMFLVSIRFFDDEKYLDFRVSYSKDLSLFFAFFIPVNCIIGILFNLKKATKKNLNIDSTNFFYTSLFCKKFL